MKIEIFYRLVVFIEILVSALSVLILFEDVRENWPGLLAGAMFVAFLYYVFHIPLKKRLLFKEGD